MMLQTKYITIDEFDEYFGENLRLELGSESKALGFIKRIEDRVATFIDSNFNRNVDQMFPQFSDYQKEHYKLALLEQCIYIFRNGDISTDSGIDTDRGEVVSKGRLQSSFLAPNCIDNLRLCGLWNKNIRATNRNYFFPWGW